MEPLFSIVIACHNHEALVRKAVNSALKQRHPSVEIIAVDDGSQDGTADVLKGFGEAIVFAALPVNQGAATARNHGASLASGEYLVFLDGDDELKPWALDVYDRLIKASHPTLILGRSEICVGEVPVTMGQAPPHAIEYVEYSDFFSKDRPWVYNTSSLIVHRSTFLSAGGWSSDIFYQDIQDLLNKLGTSGKVVLLLAPETVWYRMHSTNAVRRVLPFVEGIYVLLAKAEAGAYPGGQRFLVKRSAWFGGLILYWCREALRAGLYRDGLKLLALKGWRVLLAIAYRGAARLAGRMPVRTLPLNAR